MTSCIGQENLMIVGIVELGERNTETSRIWRELNIWEVCFVAPSDPSASSVTRYWPAHYGDHNSYRGVPETNSRFADSGIYGVTW
ncbi:uncharacterized protein AtWU_02302 [Aspergillus tubingensis]|uniref:uncharacterized protein n=1 Tax=Aspergillus tubingensis TaxID=5068 RepID=UPI001579397E|nr:uncharacterized protein AtWU_02302 [Aspergillus tubingensis]GFN12505.1 hypothetical protein AtWU_02302 [Aspergillus tubingensis]